MLEVNSIHLNYGKSAIVKGVNLKITRGEFVAIVGPNGCGKSTLLKAITRLIKPVRGEVLFDGENIALWNRKRMAKHIALLPQYPMAPSGIVVEELVRYGRYPFQGMFRQWSKEDAFIVNKVMEQTQTTEFSSRRLSELSGGQRQRAWLAMVLAQQSSLLLLDEPTSALDMGHQIEVLKLVKEQTKQQSSVVMVMHDLAAAVRYADRIVAMKDGIILADGSPNSVITQPLIQALYGVDAHILTAPCDGLPVIVPRSNNTFVEREAS